MNRSQQEFKIQISQSSSKLNDRFSIQDFDDFEQINHPNTPLSKEACQSIGCNPSDLLYKPQECFKNISKDENIQKMHYHFHEAKRRTVKNERSKLVQEMERSKMTYQIQINSEIFSPRISTQSKTSRANMSARTPNKDRETPLIMQNSNYINSSLDFIDKERANYLRSLQNVYIQELKAVQKMKEIEEQNKIDNEMEQLIKKQKEEEEKKKNLNRKLLEIEKQRKACKFEQESRRKALELKKKDKEENKRSQKKIMEKIQKIRQRQQESEQKRKENYVKTETSLIQNEIKLRKKIEMKEQEEQIRLNNLEVMRQLKLGLSRKKKKLIEQKRYSMIEEMKMIAIQRKNKLIEKLQQKDQKQDQILMNKLTQTERLRSISVHRDKKVQKARVLSQEFLENRQGKLNMKEYQDLKRLQEIKKEKEKNLKYKKELEKLKTSCQMENKQRNMIHLDYQKRKILKRVDFINSKAEHFLNQKQKQQRDGLNINTESQILKSKVRELINQMSVKNKWDMDLLTNAVIYSPNISEYSKYESKRYQEL